MKINMYVAVAVRMLTLGLAGCSGGDKSQEAAERAYTKAAEKTEEEKAADIYHVSET